MAYDELLYGQMMTAMEQFAHEAHEMMRTGRKPNPITPELLELIATYARPFLAGVMSRCVDSDQVGDENIVLNSEQMDKFVLSIILFGIDIGRHYEALSAKNWEGPQFQVPSMNN